MSDNPIAASIVDLRKRLAIVFEDDSVHHRTAQIFSVVLAVLIVVNVGSVILETVEPLRARYAAVFAAIERFASGVFVVEYLLRLWTAVDLRNQSYRHPLWGRLRYLGSFFALVDLIAILPAVLGMLGAGHLRVLRLLRLLRMLKLTRHSSVFNMIWMVLREEAQTIAALVFILCLTVTTSGSLMYMIEGDQENTLFTSIPVSMWWAIETLTTVGYGDMIPATAVGRVLGGVVIVVGIVTLALFSGVVTASFIGRLRIRRENARRLLEHGHGTCPHCGQALGPHARV
jgi:voltage-gated potassium channel